MGVRGLTSYIARNAERYLHPHELHDCDLVIDGDNLACNLYKDVSGCNSAFGGDYDTYYRTVIHFFQVLNECHIRPFVLLDGGYEAKKIRTIERRVRSKIGLVKYLNPMHSKPLFPLMMREVFIDAARDSGAHVMRCIFEADDELAVLSRKLGAPILSYDSDFYIHNVLYIPLVTLTMKVLVKDTHEQRTVRKLRQCEAKSIAKRTQIRTTESAPKDGKKSKRKTVKYLDCCIYTIESLTGTSLSTEMLPIFAALLGNDYIDRRLFRAFYTQMGFRGVNNTAAKQQKRVTAILKWLQHETKESALAKILERMQKDQRGRLLAQIESATSGYSCETSEAFSFFNLEEPDVENDAEETSDENDGEEGSSCSSEEEAECSDSEEGQATSDSKEFATEEEEIPSASDSEHNDQEQNDSLSESDDDTSPVLDDTEKHGIFPDWLKQRINSGELPRYFTDLVHLRMYINNPQVENFLFEDCNEISLKILQYIFTIVNHPEAPELRYLTRVIRLTNVHYKTVMPLELQSSYDPDSTDLDSFKMIFRDLPDSDKLFEDIARIPSHLQLYFLAIVYWAQNTTHSSHLHLHSLIICLIVLFVIDGKVEPIRDPSKFQKKFGKLITKARKAKTASSTVETDKPPPTADKHANRTVPEKLKFITKAECLLVMESNLKYFHLNESFQKRHNDFSSTILHGFSEFQSVIFHLGALNALFRDPFEPIRISQCYNGLFLYNVYTSLRTRTDLVYFVLHFVFHESKIMAEFYQYLVEWCGELFSPLQQNEKYKPSAKKSGKQKRKAIPLTDIIEPVEQGDGGDALVSDDSEYNDLNNKFAALLKVR